MGATAGDFDNDGWTDLYLTKYGENRLLRNERDGTFRDVTRAAGAGDPRWSTAATSFDYDRDGWLDLFVGNYLDFTYENHTVCRARSTARDYCGPQQYRGLPGRLLRNRGNGTFEDATAAAGMAGARGKTLGVDAGDFDGDGDADLFMTNLTNEKNTLFVSVGGAADGHLLFEDRSMESGLGAPSLPFTGFGALFVDFDSDGWLDLPVVNGAVYTIEEQARAGDPHPLRQVRQLFRNHGDGTFTDVSADAGPAFAEPEVGRGLAAGDLDNDGDTDLVVFNNNGLARFLRNDVRAAARWLGLRLTRGAPARDALGARVAVTLEDGRTLWRRAHADGSYLSASDARVLVGLGANGRVRGITVHWPDGGAEEWAGLEPGRYHTLAQGAGRPVR